MPPPRRMPRAVYAASPLRHAVAHYDSGADAISPAFDIYALHCAHACHVYARADAWKMDAHERAIIATPLRRAQDKQRMLWRLCALCRNVYAPCQRPFVLPESGALLFAFAKDLRLRLMLLPQSPDASPRAIICRHMFTPLLIESPTPPCLRHVAR